ncbi:polyunsaturated fatty acid desaturase [Chondrus crispus]|uniref:Polyunsaturated fatty acid desaturase n=1 Tax=Chondrus crispus TaxID=2769 RepID=R7Q503_CHOCR|nr:polyunsaturated fatty acid desaturase [Chondrus crispus]CDF33627.1 polyunsaturated fatty acid desaturase [Chondrus crispus]|eukprot:XP_005713430.1 polyunsaturated fatty acid desaturase [Chondrus crispus]
MSCLACALTPLGWWALLPLLALQLEAFALLHDARVLGRVTRRPSPKASFENPSATFTWQELARHNAEESAWVAVDGLVYDITEFVDRHPGGKEILLFALGRDATNLFNSYHPFTDVPRVVLKKYRIGSLATFEHPVYKPDSGFYKEASQVLKRYFEENGVDSKNPWNGVVRMAPVYVCFFAAYYAIYCVPGVPFAARVALAVLLGVCQGMPLTGWMHDASHVSIGRSEKWWWGVGRFSLDYMSGSSMVSWRNQHVLGHHVYTNVMGADPDLPTDLAGDPRRLVQQQAWASVYRWQHLYLPPLYGILALKSRMQDLTEVFSKHTNGPIRVNPISVQDYLRMLSAKAVWLFYRVVVPYVFLTAVSRPQLAVLFLATEFTTGYWLAFNFQVSHISDEVDFLFSDTAKRESGKCPAVYEQEWAESQIKTTIDYSHDSPLAAYFSGALNYQTIHHLFPCVSQYHYPTVNPLIMDVAKKYGYEFKVYDSYADALAAHIRHLRNLGREGKPAELKLE